MNAVVTHDADRRRANFYRGTMRDPDANAITKDQVTNAIVSIMTADSTGGQIDMALASTIAGQVLPSVIKQFAGMAPEQLSSQPAFRSMLQLYIAPGSADERIAAQKRLQAANVTSADFAAASRAADTGLASPLLGRRGADGTERAASGARYDGMGGERLSPVDLQNMASARSAAISLGMPWALNNPELLKLGAGAIKTLHEAGVQKERCERMVGDKVGFRAATAVDIAAFAKKHNLTPEQTNALFDKISNGVEIISGGNKAIQRELDEATRKYVTGPDTPEARKALEDTYKKHADTPEKREAAETTTKALQAAAQQAQADVAARDEKVVKADAKVEKTEAKEVKEVAAAAANSAGLDDPPAKSDGQPRAPAQGATPSGTAPAAKAPAKPPAPK